MLTPGAMAHLDPRGLLRGPFFFDLALLLLLRVRTPPSALLRLHDGIMTAVVLLPHLMTPEACHDPLAPPHDREHGTAQLLLPDHPGLRRAGGHLRQALRQITRAPGCGRGPGLSPLPPPGEARLLELLQPSHLRPPVPLRRHPRQGIDPRW